MSVALFTLGGTISMAGDRRLTGDDLTAAVPGLAELDHAVEIQDVEKVPSANLTASKMLDVVDAASKAVADGATGVVVTQGTDNLEETAFLVDQMWPHPQPFVLTGAMRNPTLAGPDGPANLWPPYASPAPLRPVTLVHWSCSRRRSTLPGGCVRLTAPVRRRSYHPTPVRSATSWRTVSGSDPSPPAGRRTGKG